MITQTDLVDFSQCEYSERDGTYGGQAGAKDGIIYQGEYWLIKYPKTTKDMQVKEMSYTTSPLLEYIGSRIYQILGYDVHKTLLGIRNKKLVVACKDFCRREGALREIRTIKNANNKELADILEASFSSTGTEHIIELDEIILHLEYNRILSKVEGIKERFWDCVVIDILINNNDRNNGNWGILYEEGNYKLAPIFDNGASFSDKLSETSIRDMLINPAKLSQSAIGTVTAYSKNGHKLTAKKLLELDRKELNKAIKKNVPLIKAHMDEMKTFLLSIPEKYHDIDIISSARKEFYIKGMELRFEKLLLPAYEKRRK